MKKIYKPFAFLFISSTLIFSSCKEEPKEEVIVNNPPAADQTAFTLDFKPLFNGETIEYNKMKYVSSSSDTLNFTRLRFILSKIQLVKDNNEIVELDTFALLAFDLNRNKLGTNQLIPNGNYKEIRFRIGLDSNLNHGDPNNWPSGHPLDPLVNHMHWTWASGYIFSVVEGYYMNNGNDLSIFSYHMANMEFIRDITITPNQPIIIDGSKKTVNINVNMENYFHSPNKYSLKLNGPISHSSSQADRDRMMLLNNNLGSVFEIK